MTCDCLPLQAEVSSAVASAMLQVSLYMWRVQGAWLFQLTQSLWIKRQLWKSVLSHKAAQTGAMKQRASHA